MTTNDEVIKNLSVKEKALLVSGTQSMRTNAIKRLGIPQLEFADGPHGLRKLRKNGVDGLSDSEKATCFPVACAMACGWNEENIKKVGAAIGNEAAHYGVSVLLAPGINIKRDPRCGRCFEYYSEDPLLAGKLASAFTKGVQECGVGVSVKHFACNSNEAFRYMGNSVVDERALREIYLRAFERVVKEQKPYTIMCAYNKINGTYCASNKKLLTDILRNEWGFDGLVMSDWGAVDDRVTSLEAGLDLEMPGDAKFFRKHTIKAYNDGTLEKDALTNAVSNLLSLISKAEQCKKYIDADFEAHNVLAGEIAADCAVLLKNDGVLPLKKEGKYLCVGEMFLKMRYQGAGSSLVNAAYITSPKEAFDAAGVKYTLNESEAAECEAVIYFGGLTDEDESEGFDRPNIAFPSKQLDEINKMRALNKPIIVVLFGGGVMEVPFENDAAAILYMALPGQNGGSAVHKLLFGEKNPCGKLAETWCAKTEDIMYHDNYAKRETELYRESVFVGYRYYQTAKEKVRYPFGFGLSYTTFELSDIKTTVSNEQVNVSCTAKNIGERRGAEVVQVYSALNKSCVPRPTRELRGFKKVYLDPMEAVNVNIEFPIDELAFYDAKANCWKVESGEYTFEAAVSAENIRLTAQCEIKGESHIEPLYNENVLKAYSGVNIANISDCDFAALLGHALPSDTPLLPITLDSRLPDMTQTKMGKRLYKLITSVADSMERKALKMSDGVQRDNKIKAAQFMRRTFETNSLRSLFASSSGVFTYKMALFFMETANGSLMKGIKRFIHG